MTFGNQHSYGATSRALLLTCSLALPLASVACTDTDALSAQEQEAKEKGVLSRMFQKMSDYFGATAAEDVAIAPVEAWTPPVGVDDPAVDELFDLMGLEEVKPAEDVSLDGALVGLYEHFPNDDDPDDYYDSVCFFAQSPDMMPSQESLFWAEMFGVRSGNGKVSDIQGHEIGMECVGCAEGNTDGDETRVIFYVNGIKTSSEQHCDQLELIANKTGAVVIGVYNETEGTVRDIWQTTWDRFTVQVENTLANHGINKTVEIHQNSAATVLTNVVMQRIRQGKHVEIWAHSQGGAVTALALNRAIRALTAEGLYPVQKDGENYPEAIRVITFGSAASQWPEGLWPNGPVYTHFVHQRDATPSALGVGAWGGFLTVGKQRAGGDANMVFFDGEPIDEEDASSEGSVPNFTVIEPEAANVRFLDLELKTYHHFDGVYLQMFEQRHGAWYH